MWLFTLCFRFFLLIQHLLLNLNHTLSDMLLGIGISCTIATIKNHRVFYVSTNNCAKWFLCFGALPRSSDYPRMQKIVLFVVNKSWGELLEGRRLLRTICYSHIICMKFALKTVFFKFILLSIQNFAKSTATKTYQLPYFTGTLITQFGLAQWTIFITAT